MKNLFLIIFTLISINVFATFQTPDKIIIDNNEFSLTTYPFEKYFELYPDKRPKSISTSLHRGYLAIYEVINNEIYLKDIKVEYQENNQNIIQLKSIMNELFPNKKLIKIDWISSILIGYKGLFTSHINNYTLLEINNGLVNEMKEFSDYKSYNKFVKQQYKLFEKTTDFELIKENFFVDNPNIKKSKIRKMLKNNILKYSTHFLD